MFYILLFSVVCSLVAPYLPAISIGTSSEPHRNLIGTSPNDERIIKCIDPNFLDTLSS